VLRRSNPVHWYMECVFI